MAPPVEPTYYVQAVADDGWWTFYRTDNKHLGHALALKAQEKWEQDCRFTSKARIQRDEGIAVLRRAERDLANMDTYSRREVNEMAAAALLDAERALERVSKTKHAIADAEAEFLDAIMQASTVYDYSIREIGEQAGLSQARIHQMMQEAQGAAA